MFCMHRDDRPPPPPQQPQAGPWPRQQPPQPSSPATPGKQPHSERADSLDDRAETSAGVADDEIQAAAPDDGDGNNAAGAAPAQQKRWQDRLKRRLAGVIHLDDPQHDEGRAAHRPAGVVAVQLPGAIAAGSGGAGDAADAPLPPENVSPRGQQVEPAQQQQQQQPGAQQQRKLRFQQQPGSPGVRQRPRGGISGHVAHVAAELEEAEAASGGRGGGAGQGLARERRAPVPQAQGQQSPNPKPQGVQLSTGGRRVLSPPPAPPLRSALRPGQTPFGAPHMQQHPLDDAQRCGRCATA